MGVAGVEVRRATAADKRAVMEVARASIGGMWSEAALASELERSISEVWLARADGQDAGFAIAWRVAPEAELLLIGVVPEMRRRSVATAVLGALEGSLAASGVEEIHLEVRASNAGARAFYRSLGYRETGVRRRYYRDNDEDAVLMTHRLR